MRKAFERINGLTDSLRALQDSIVRWVNNINNDLYDRVMYVDFVPADLVSTTLTITHNRPSLQFVNVQFTTGWDDWYVSKQSAESVSIKFSAGTKSGRVQLTWL